MKRFLVLLLALVGCATSGPGSYQQAVRPAPYQPPPAYTPGYAPGTPAAPVYTPQGAGAYRGEPQSSTAVPRSKDKRVLPREKDGAPGLWAADPVHAIDPREKLPETPILLGFTLPFPLAAESEADRYWTRMCAYKMGNAVKETDRAEDWRRLSQDIQRCLAARLYEHCVNFSRSGYEAFERKGALYLPENLTRIKATQETAEAFRKTACGDFPLPSDARRIHDEAAELFELEAEAP